MTEPSKAQAALHGQAGRIYLDNAASTPVDPRVRQVMLPLLAEVYGNPSSLHRHGVEAASVLAGARETLARLLSVAPHELIFTASGTESNNLAIKGAALANRDRGNHILISAIEHASVVESCAWLRAMDFEVEDVPVDGEGLVDPALVARAIRKTTVLVSIMHANNETGVIEPIEEIGAICRSRGVLFHTDASQSFGKIPLSPTRQHLDLATLSSHKIYGPRGAAALYLRKGVRLMPWIHGGGQELGLRGATENVASILGLAKAAELCVEEMSRESERLLTMRERILGELGACLPDMYLNGSRRQRLPANINVGFAGLEGLAPNLLLALDESGISVSTGSACSSNSASRPSHVLVAMGRNPLEALGALRVSLGRFTTAEDVDRFVLVMREAVGDLRQRGFGARGS